ncbi:hypothetical protein A2886_02830 [candidate division WWE3 bacterium RIFCSPHIGHO2_01_FULL_42_13]|uniref:Uncharacterized protein n=1 Tax=candidate division WWE3 bacterium RIFCSPHIGHO2_01_FULL_42_13 TaxID=1802617 RepID=A0A1F4URS4_UNCKA|nr:MAG: hypothetical protein A2886_02830 [candidate division WWE3 bacterium RIFCSPHIGHO2_01_FULL_42_13]
MRGTLIDVAIVIATALLGLGLKRWLHGKNYENQAYLALGLTAIPIGVMFFLGTVNPLIVLISIVFGVLLGQWIGIAPKIDKLAEWFKNRVAKKEDTRKFVDALVTATVISVVGPLAIMGPILERVAGQTNLIETKWVFDGVATFFLALTMGRGVLWSFLPILAFQTTFSLLGWLLGPFFLPDGCTFENTYGNITRKEVMDACLAGRKVVDEMTAAGGVLIMAMGIKVAGLRDDFEVVNFIPAILIAAILRWLLVATVIGTIIHL